ncbi:MAG: hypothetical protein NZM00_05785, partial [Anaerolinea sp.]|nr:hypothetical protein [Anaerolinea sp.]
PLLRAGIELPSGSLAAQGSFHSSPARIDLLPGQKGSAVTRAKRNIWEEIARRVRDLVSDLDRLINPQPPRPVRVPVPVPGRQPGRSREDAPAR